MISFPIRQYISHPVSFLVQITGGLMVVVLGLWNLIVGILLKSNITSIFLPNNLPIANDAAICFIFTGFAVLSLLYYKRNTAFIFALLMLCVASFAFIGVLADKTLYNHNLLGLPIGMSSHTIICFILMGLALLLVVYKNHLHFAQYLFHAITIISFIVLLGHIFNVAQFYRFNFISAMSIYTAIGFLIISVTASVQQPSLGLTGLFTGALIGNIMARKIFFKLVLIIVALGYIRIMVHRSNILEPELATAMLVVVCILLFLYIIEKTTRTLNYLDRKKQKAQNNLRMAIESAPYALVISNKQGEILTVNACTEKLYGYKREELIGKYLEMLIPQSKYKDYQAKRDLFFADPDPVVIKYGFDDNLFALNHNGVEFPIELVLTPIRTEEEPLVLACITDMTLRKRHETLIREQLMEMRFRTEELEQITAMVSHDLQEPLRTVANYAEMLEEDYTDQFCGETRVHVRNMKATVIRMSLMLKYLLDYSRLGRDRDLTLTDCNEVLNTVKNDLSALLKNNQADIIINGRLPVNYAYETELRQLFQNLIQNAVKYKQKNVKPQVIISCRANNNFYEFSISDNGIGIAPEHQQRIFHIFKRLEGTGNIEGNGVGLAFVKKIVEMHGGNIWVESETGKGATFKFTIIDFKPIKK